MDISPKPFNERTDMPKLNVQLTTSELRTLVALAYLRGWFTSRGDQGMYGWAANHDDNGNLKPECVARYHLDTYLAEVFNED